MDQQTSAPARPTATRGDSGNGEASHDDPLFSLHKDWKSGAAGHLDASTASWLASPPPVANLPCTMSCHTTFASVMARSVVGSDTTPNIQRARLSFESRVDDAVAGTAVPFYGKNRDAKVRESHATESVLNATALVFDDLGTSGAVSANAKKAVLHMWSLQNDDGSWDWLEFGLEPWESRNDYGAGMAALTVGMLADHRELIADDGKSKLIRYIQTRATASGAALHDRAIFLWASGSLAGLLRPEQTEAIAKELTKRQLGDGGFSLGSFGRGAIADESLSGDGYATAIAVLALCKGLPDEDARRENVRRGLAWLATNREADGSWAGRSVNSKSDRAAGFMTDAATAHAALAIYHCGESVAP